MNCCEYFRIDCNQGRNCPLKHSASAATEIGVSDAEPPLSLKTLLWTAALMMVAVMGALLY